MVFSIKDPLRLKTYDQFIGKLTGLFLKTPKSMTMSFVVPRSQDEAAIYATTPSMAVQILALSIIVSQKMRCIKRTFSFKLYIVTVSPRVFLLV